MPDLPELVALTPQLLDMLRAVHVANLVKHFTHFCANSYFQPNGPLMLNARAQLKACQGAGVLPLQSLSKGEKWTVSLIEDKELKKSVLRSWEQYWASNSSAAEIKRVVTKDMQKQVRGVVHGQTDFLRQICFLEEVRPRVSSVFVGARGTDEPPMLPVCPPSPSSSTAATSPTRRFRRRRT